MMMTIDEHKKQILHFQQIFGGDVDKTLSDVKRKK